MNNNYSKAYVEVLEILKYIPKEDSEKIPKDIMYTLEKCADKEYIFKINKSVPFEEQKLMEETKDILANFFRDYWATEEEKEELLKKEFKNAKNVDISRFKGLGEMPPAQLKETTMDPKKRTLLRVAIPHKATEEDTEEFNYTADIVQRLMGNKPEYRFQFIQEHAKFVENLDI